MKRRAGAYLRYSSANQRDASLDDQLRNCGNYVAQHGDQLVAEYVERDAAMSGTSMAGRDGLERLLQRICTKPAPIDYLVVDDLSRLSRDIGDTMGLVKKLAFYGVELVSIADGLNSSSPASKMGFALKSMMAEGFIDNLRAATHRGLEGQVRRGRHAGGRIFGYRTVPAGTEEDGKKLVVHAPEAEVVRKIFDLAREGRSLAAIVQALVVAGAPAPDPGSRNGRVRGWNASSVRELLRNPTYAGTLAWNRTRAVKNPDTGKRLFVARPREEWVVELRPDLVVVEPKLFAEVQELLAARGALYGRGGGGRYKGARPGAVMSPYLLSGLVKCGVCGATLTISGSKRGKSGAAVYRNYRCPSVLRRGKGACTNVTAISQLRLEAAVLAEVEEKLLSPTCVDLYEDEFRKAYAEAMRSDTASARKAALEKQVGEQRQRIERLVDFIEQGEASKNVVERLRKAEAVLAELKAEQDRLGTGPADLPLNPPPGFVRAGLERLAATLATDPIAGRGLLKDLIGELTLTPVWEAAGEPVAGTKRPTKGKAKGKKEGPPRPTHFVLSGSAYLGKIKAPLGSPGGLQSAYSVVAGAGFEPATFGL